MGAQTSSLNQSSQKMFMSGVNQSWEAQFSMNSPSMQDFKKGNFMNIPDLKQNYLKVLKNVLNVVRSDLIEIVESFDRDIILSIIKYSTNLLEEMLVFSLIVTNDSVEDVRYLVDSIDLVLESISKGTSYHKQSYKNNINDLTFTDIIKCLSNLMKLDTSNSLDNNYQQTDIQILLHQSIIKLSQFLQTSLIYFSNNKKAFSILVDLYLPDIFLYLEQSLSSEYFSNYQYIFSEINLIIETFIFEEKNLLEFSTISMDPILEKHNKSNNGKANKANSGNNNSIDLSSKKTIKMFSYIEKIFVIVESFAFNDTASDLLSWNKKARVIGHLIQLFHLSSLKIADKDQDNANNGFNKNEFTVSNHSTTKANVNDSTILQRKQLIRLFHFTFSLIKRLQFSLQISSNSLASYYLGLSVFTSNFLGKLAALLNDHNLPSHSSMDKYIEELKRVWSNNMFTLKSFFESMILKCDYSKFYDWSFSLSKEEVELKFLTANLEFVFLYLSQNCSSLHSIIHIDHRIIVDNISLYLKECMIMGNISTFDSVVLSKEAHVLFFESILTLFKGIWNLFANLRSLDTLIEGMFTESFYYSGLNYLELVLQQTAVQEMIVHSLTEIPSGQWPRLWEIISSKRGPHSSSVHNNLIAIILAANKSIIRNKITSQYSVNKVARLEDHTLQIITIFSNVLESFGPLKDPSLIARNLSFFESELTAFHSIFVYVVRQFNTDFYQLTLNSLLSYNENKSFLGMLEHFLNFMLPVFEESTKACSLGLLILKLKFSVLHLLLNIHAKLSADLFDSSKVINLILKDVISQVKKMKSSNYLNILIIFLHYTSVWSSSMDVIGNSLDGQISKKRKLNENEVSNLDSLKNILTNLLEDYLHNAQQILFNQMSIDLENSSDCSHLVYSIANLIDSSLVADNHLIKNAIKSALDHLCRNATPKDPFSIALPHLLTRFLPISLSHSHLTPAIINSLCEQYLAKDDDANEYLIELKISGNKLQEFFSERKIQLINIFYYHFIETNHSQETNQILNYLQAEGTLDRFDAFLEQGETVLQNINDVYPDSLDRFQSCFQFLFSTVCQSNDLENIYWTLAIHNRRLLVNKRGVSQIKFLSNLLLHQSLFNSLITMPLNQMSKIYNSILVDVQELFDLHTSIFEVSNNNSIRVHPYSVLDYYYELLSMKIKLLQHIQPELPVDIQDYLLSIFKYYLIDTNCSFVLGKGFFILLSLLSEKYFIRLGLCSISNTDYQSKIVKFKGKKISKFLTHLNSTINTALAVHQITKKQSGLISFAEKQINNAILHIFSILIELVCFSDHCNIEGYELIKLFEKHFFGYYFDSSRSFLLANHSQYSNFNDVIPKVFNVFNLFLQGLIEKSVSIDILNSHRDRLKILIQRLMDIWVLYSQRYLYIKSNPNDIQAELQKLTIISYEISQTNSILLKCMVVYKSIFDQDASFIETIKSTAAHLIKHWSSETLVTIELLSSHILNILKLQKSKDPLQYPELLVKVISQTLLAINQLISFANRSLFPRITIKINVLIQSLINLLHSLALIEHSRDLSEECLAILRPNYQLFGRILTGISNISELTKQLHIIVAIFVNFLSNSFSSHEFQNKSSQGDFMKACKDIIYSGIYSMFDKLESKQKEIMFKTLDLAARALMNDIHNEYLRVYKFHGN